MVLVGRLLGGLTSAVPLVESLNASTSVDQLLLTREVRVALVAQFDLHQAALGASCHERISTRALDRCLFVLWMDVCLHFDLLEMVARRVHLGRL